MSPEEFRAIRKRLGLNQAQLAAKLEYGAATRISEIETGMVPVPRLVALLMQAWGEHPPKPIVVGGTPEDGGVAYHQRMMGPAHADTVRRKAPHKRS